MWKVAIFLISISATVLADVSKELSHLEKLKARYPYGVIGDDYGLLEEEDLAVNTCNAVEITPFSGDKNMAYSYWQCFPLKVAKISCHNLGYDPVIRKETGYLEIEARNESGVQYYLARDARDIRECREYLLRWEQKTRGEEYICISGSFGGFEDRRDGHKERHWVLDKFKTHKGCVSSGGECSLKERSTLENCLMPSPKAAH